MLRVTLPLPLLVFTAGTRVLLGAGAALLLGERLRRGRRRALGRTLVGVGVITTVPIVAMVVRSLRQQQPDELPGQVAEREAVLAP